VPADLPAQEPLTRYKHSRTFHDETVPVYLHVGLLTSHPHLLFEALAYTVGFRLYLELRRMPMRLTFALQKSCIHIVHSDGRLIPCDIYDRFDRDDLEHTRLTALRQPSPFVH
jgi:hypothetical protein